MACRPFADRLELCIDPVQSVLPDNEQYTRYPLDLRIDQKLVHRSHNGIVAYHLVRFVPCDLGAVRRMVIAQPGNPAGNTIKVRFRGFEQLGAYAHRIIIPMLIGVGVDTEILHHIIDRRPRPGRRQLKPRQRQ